MKTIATITLAVALAGSLSACLTAHQFADPFYKEAVALIVGTNPTNTNPEIQSVAVAPMFNQTQAAAAPNMVAYADIFATELVRSSVFEKVIRPDQVIRAMAAGDIPAIRDANDVRELGRLLNVDAVFVGAITDFDPYYPPRIGFAMQVFRTDNSLLSAIDIEALNQTGKPIMLSSEGRDHPLLGGEWIFDIRDNRMENRYKLYALARQGGDRPLGIERLARRTSEYFRFVSYSTIVYLMEQEEARQEKLLLAMARYGEG